MRVTMLLADAAQAVNGKLYILGGGWSVAGPGPVTMAIAFKIDVPWDQSNRRHTLRLALYNEDGQPVMLPTPEGNRPFELSAEFEVGRPPGIRPGTDLDVPLAINFGSLPLPPGAVYVWKCWIDGQTRDDWRLAFTTRPAQNPAGAIPGL